jgi:hypothetical protein
MLTKEELIELFSNANRKLFLGEDIYEKCRRNGSKVTRGELEKRLDFWKNNYEVSHMFKKCNVDDVVRICNFSPDEPVGDILDNKCYQDIRSNIRLDTLEEANTCSICYEYNKGEEFPNRLGCGHYFHYSCLNDWVGRGNTTCPTCRQPINMLLGFPKQSNEGLFKTIQKIDKQFTRKYINEMKLFMTKDEIIAFKQIHNIELEEGNLKDKLLMFLIISFLYNLIVSGTSYLSTKYDPEGMENVESIVIIPTTIYFGYQQVILLLSIFGNILNKLRD